MKGLLNNWVLIHTVVGILVGGFIGLFSVSDGSKNTFWGFLIGGIIGGLAVYVGLLLCECSPLQDLIRRVRF